VSNRRVPCGAKAAGGAHIAIRAERDVAFRIAWWLAAQSAAPSAQEATTGSGPGLLGCAWALWAVIVNDRKDRRILLVVFLHGGMCLVESFPHAQSRTIYSRVGSAQ